MPVIVWVMYQRMLPVLQGEERAAWSGFLDPIITAVFSAFADKSGRRRGAKTIQRAMGILRRIPRPWREKHEKWTGRLSEEASRKLDAQIGRLARTEKAFVGRGVKLGTIQIVKAKPDASGNGDS